MAKKGFFIGMAAVLVFTVCVFGGCYSTMPHHYGEMPEPGEKLCTLILPGNLVAAQYQGDFGTPDILRISAGSRTIVFNYSSESSSVSGNIRTTSSASASGIEVTHEFQPGHTYRAHATVENDRNTGKRMVKVEITEAWIPLQPGVRFGIFPGWLTSSGTNEPVGGLFATVQAGVMTTGDTPVELMAEGLVGGGYGPFSSNSDDFDDYLDMTIQGGGTLNVYLGKSDRKVGLGLGGGVGVDYANNDNLTPYVRASFIPFIDPKYETLPHVRLFVDYSFTQKELWKRFGLGLQFFYDGGGFGY